MKKRWLLLKKSSLLIYFLEIPLNYLLFFITSIFIFIFYDHLTKAYLLCIGRNHSRKKGSSRGAYVFWTEGQQKVAGRTKFAL